MSLRDDRDFSSHFLTAQERDLGPLVRESEALLHLSGEQALGLQTFLNKAWLSGTQVCQAPLDVKLLEAELKALMDESADTLNLTVSETVSMWDFLGRACIAGIHSCRTEITALLFETSADIGEEALRWLDGRGVDDA